MAGRGASRETNADSAPHPFLREDGLVFLRGLARNNRREWFESRRPVFERELRQPMLAIVRVITDGMATWAPEHVRPAEKSMMRIYRDIRFSNDKRPYKSHMAAWWSRAGMDKTSGAGFYLQISAEEVHVAAGVYMPEKQQLQSIRTHLLAHHAQMQSLLAKPALRRRFQPMDGNPLSRTPKGFPSDTAADALLRQRQWGVGAFWPAAAAIDPHFAKKVAEHFRVANPLVQFLNAPLVSGSRARRVLFGLQ